MADIFEVLRNIGLTRPQALILQFLMVDFAWHTQLDITKGTDLPQPAVSIGTKALAPFIVAANRNRAVGDRGRPGILYKARPIAEIEAVLRQRLDEKESVLAAARTAIEAI